MQATVASGLLLSFIFNRYLAGVMSFHFLLHLPRLDAKFLYVLRKIDQCDLLFICYFISILLIIYLISLTTKVNNAKCKKSQIVAAIRIR